MVFETQKYCIFFPTNETTTCFSMNQTFNCLFIWTASLLIYPSPKLPRSDKKEKQTDKHVDRDSDGRTDLKIDKLIISTDDKRNVSHFCLLSK
jgi:hypothetical protein